MDQAAAVLLGDILVRATPLILTGLAVAIAFQAGVLNIGAEGQFLIGAACSTAASFFFARFGVFALVLCVLAGIAGGSLWAAIAAELRSRFHVLEVISTIVLNFIATYLISFLVRGPLQEPTHIYPQSSSLPDAARLPLLIPGTRLHIGFTIAVIVGGFIWWFLRTTAAGFRIRAAGANPHAAEITGRIDVRRTTTHIFLISGGLAGLAGALEVQGVTFALYENISPGYGYSAIAVALLAALNPVFTIITGLFFGAVETVATSLQRDYAVPATLATVFEASVILVALSIRSVRAKFLSRPGAVSEPMT